MGLTLNKAFGKLFGKQEVRINMVGLDAAGKTSILHKLKLGPIVTTIPENGFTIETVEYKNIKFAAWDVGGQDEIRPLWRHYLQNTAGLIFVVNSYDRDRINEARDELNRMLEFDELRDAVLLVFANVQDIPNAMTKEEVEEKLGLHNLRGRSWYTQASCAVCGDGLYEGLDWLSTSIAHRRKEKRLLQDEIEDTTTEEQHNGNDWKHLGKASRFAPHSIGAVARPPSFDRLTMSHDFAGGMMVPALLLAFALVALFVKAVRRPKGSLPREHEKEQMGYSRQHDEGQPACYGLEHEDEMCNSGFEHVMSPVYSMKTRFGIALVALVALIGAAFIGRLAMHSNDSQIQSNDHFIKLADPAKPPVPFSESKNLKQIQIENNALENVLKDAIYDEGLTVQAEKLLEKTTKASDEVEAAEKADEKLEAAEEKLLPLLKNVKKDQKLLTD